MNLPSFPLYFHAWLDIKQVYAFACFCCRSLQKEVESYQNKVERKTGQVDTISKEDNVCEICQKTKFTDGAGKECKYCKLKVCARCGVQVTIPGTKQVNYKNSLSVFYREKCVKDTIVIIGVIHIFSLF